MWGERKKEGVTEMLGSAKVKGKGKKGVRGRLVKSWLDKEGEKKVKRKEESIEWKRLPRGSEMEEYDTIKRSLNSEIETFVFHILCKHLNPPSVWETGGREQDIFQHNLPLWCLSGSAAGDFENRLFV